MRGFGHLSLTPLGTATDPVPAAVDWSPDGEWLIGKAFYPTCGLRSSASPRASGYR
jgi:hypothetical protein